ncbi:transglutaminase [Adhaeribacter arboris]|uniref:Transglutaminase n=1 Tax=Adhaeribacter arboris TaxID=2072846 RepID=A0A2T2YLF2_9BACT|nr:transglutaminase family protein [Adhaeribacter arboris]PSR56295.1 transglutaminase [Adhaeribacter arboris]
MAVRVSIFHQTKYEYDRPVFLSPHLFRLKPAAHSRTPIEAYSLIIKPDTHIIHWQQDPFGNFVARVDFQEPMREMLIEVEIIAHMVPLNPFDFFLDAYAEYFPFTYEAQLKKDLGPYLEVSLPGPQMEQLLQRLDQSKRGTVDFLIMLNQLIYQNISYTVRLQPGVQTSEESLMQALGSCRDSAWLLVQIMRHLGLAARFVSGYSVQLIAENLLPTRSFGLEQDVVALHAWAEVFIPGAGWIGLDATSGLLAGEGHIPLACTANPDSAAPITGTTGISETSFTYINKVKRI